MKAEIISVGTELLLGQITDTNASYLAQHLSPLGIDLYWISAVGDNLGRLSEAVRRALDRSDLTIMTGGLGPTEDDLTREAICAVLGEEMTVVPALEDDLRDFFTRRGVEMPARNVKQATLIPSARAIPNPIGTAPGWWVEKDGHIIVAMPGVPVEMYRMWTEDVAPRLRQRYGGVIIFSKTLKVTGLGESTVEEMIRPLLNSANPTLATYAKADGIHVRITAKARTNEEALALIAGPEARAREILGDTIYGVDDEPLEGVVAELLRERGLTVATMEGLTAGLLAAGLTAAPGSTAYFRGGAVTYTVEAMESYGVDPALLRSEGPIGMATSSAMATAIRRRLGTDIGIGTTGVAGPTAQDDKPVGSVYIAIDNAGRYFTDKMELRTTRAEVRRRAAWYALTLLRRSLIER
ncbi:MAG: competence/damage-inducible protein A [Chloroflexota bacterium]